MPLRLSRHGPKEERLATIKAHLAQFPDVEAVCQRCGRCCYYKVFIDDDLYYTPFPCRFLDPKTRLCTVYEKRHEINRACISLVNAIEMEILPPDCPYVRDLEGYRGPKLDGLDDELLDELARLIGEDPELVHEAWVADVEMETTRSNEGKTNAAEEKNEE